MKKTILLLAVAVLAAAALTRALAAPPAPKRRIARVWHGQVAAARGDEYAKYLYEDGVRKIRRTPGNLGATMLRRQAGDRADFVVISYWPSEESIRAWAGPNLTKTRLMPRDLEFLIEPELEVKHYTIVAEE